MTQTHRFPSAGQAIVLLLAALALAIGLMSGLGWLMAALQIRIGGSRGTLLGLVQLLALGSAIAWGWARTGLPFREVFPLRPVRLSLLAPILLALVGITLVNGEVARVIRPFLPRWAGELDIVRLLTQSPANLWGFWIALVIVAPITEEFLFRGLILQGFLSRYSVRRAIIISSILFGAVHLDLLKFLGTTAIGALFAWLFVRTRSLVPSLLGHGLLNGWQVALLGIISTTIDPMRLREAITQGLDRPFNAATALVGVSFAGLAVFWLKRMLRDGEGRKVEPTERPSGEVTPVRRYEGPPNGASAYPSILQAIWLLFLIVV
ncbi:MAG TPA: CPBP family intramembrane glutamic endopeptidase, partial [bacterium]|nr:CPBP family intramembrane glutamic endopeptidase [bacterium]